MTEKQKPYTLRPLQPGDLQHLAENLRPADARELEAASGHTRYLERLAYFETVCDEAMVCEVDGAPILVFGIAAVTPNTSAIGLCGTPAMSKLRRPLVEEADRIIQRWFEERPGVDFMVNYSHAENTQHHRWLRLMGATLLPEEPVGFDGAPFRPFFIRRDAPCATPA
jgi:hypothetical protein